MNIVLASTSPRRHELLERIVDKFDIVDSSFDEESIRFDGNVHNYVCKLAEGKAKAAKNKLNCYDVIIGCDTLVFHDGKVMGKPKDEEDAIKMLKELSGSTHRVYSGIAIIDGKNGNIVSDSIFTEVKFMEITDDMILKYVKSGQCFGKAGAYGIQDSAAVFVEGINGCYYNVVGLPINKLFVMLREMGVNL